MKKVPEVMGTPSRNPQNIDQRSWYYEGRRHFTFVHEARHPITGFWIQTDQFKVSTAMLRKSLARCYGRKVKP